jgi:hypothetical protein
MCALDPCNNISCTHDLDGNGVSICTSLSSLIESLDGILPIFLSTIFIHRKKITKNFHIHGDGETESTTPTGRTVAQGNRSTNLDLTEIKDIVLCKRGHLGKLSDAIIEFMCHGLGLV